MSVEIDHRPPVKILIPEETAWVLRDAAWDAAKMSRREAARCERERAKAEEDARQAEIAGDADAFGRADRREGEWRRKRRLAEGETDRRMRAFGAVCSALQTEYEKERE